MQRKFLTNLALLLFLNILIKPFWILGIDRSVQNVVGAEDYGLYFALFNFSFLLNILLDIGITNFNNKNIAQNNYLLSKHFSSIVVLKMALVCFYASITLLSEQFKLLLLLAFNQFLLSFILYLRSNLAGLHLFKTDSVISVLDRILMIVICGILLWGNVTEQTFQIEWLVYAQTAAYVLTAIATFILVLTKTKFMRLKWNFPFFIMILKQSFPFAVLILMMTFYNRIDTVMMERMLPDGAIQAGIYAQGYRLLDATNMIAYLFAVLLLPIFARMVKFKESVEQLVKLSFSLLITPAIIIAIGSFIYRTEMMNLLYDEHIELSAPVFGLLMSCFIAIAITYIFGTLLTANSNLKELNIMAGCGILINIALNIYLIPLYHAKGAAIASLVTQFTTALIQVLIVQYIFKFRVNYRLLITLVVFTIGVGAICYFSKLLPYQWTINGQSVDENHSDRLDAGIVRSSDRIALVVKPSDSYSEGKPKASKIIAVKNNPPKIVSVPPSGLKDGLFIYQIASEDSDKDPLRYYLLRGPTGMEIDPQSGRLAWKVVSLPGGKAEIAVGVNDGKGGKSEQRFTIQTTQ